MAYNVTRKDYKVNSAKIGRGDIVSALRRDLPKNTFQRLIKTVDQSVDSVKPSENSKLVWTKAGALFGHGSEQPKKWVEHLWEKVIAVVGDDRLCLITVGTLLLWRISLRDETWLVYNEDSGLMDDVTGKPIRISHYWIDENYIFEGPPTLKDLAAKFNVVHK